MKKLKRVCPVCEKKITNRDLNNQKVVKLWITHSLSSAENDFGDYMNDVWFCSFECYHKFMGKKRLKLLDKFDNLMY